MSVLHVQVDKVSQHYLYTRALDPRGHQENKHKPTQNNYGNYTS